MFNPSASLLSTLVVLPVLLAQQNNSTRAPAPVASNPQNGTASPTDTTAASGSFAATTFTPSLASGPTCGTAQQNFNQCITKVGRDISSCTNNVCLCQTYANIAACYNGCAELVEQGKQYQSQATQYCTVAGVKPNTTVDSPPPTTTTTSSTSNLPSSSSNNTSSTATNTSTFSAAKGSFANKINLNPFHAVGCFAASLAVLLL